MILDYILSLIKTTFNCICLVRWMLDWLLILFIFYLNVV